MKLILGTTIARRVCDSSQGVLGLFSVGVRGWIYHEVTLNKIMFQKYYFAVGVEEQ